MIDCRYVHRQRRNIGTACRMSVHEMPSFFFPTLANSFKACVLITKGSAMNDCAAAAHASRRRRSGVRIENIGSKSHQRLFASSRSNVQPVGSLSLDNLIRPSAFLRVSSQPISKERSSATRTINGVAFLQFECVHDSARNSNCQAGAPFCNLHRSVHDTHQPMDIMDLFGNQQPTRPRPSSDGIRP